MIDRDYVTSFAELEETIAAEFANNMGHDSLALYQEFHGLHVDGWAGPKTLFQMQLPRCGRPDIERDKAGLLIEEAKWPNSCLRVHLRIDWSGFNESSMGISRSDAERAFRKAVKDWNAAINIVLSLDDGDAYTTIDFRNLGGSTLAWSHLANNNCGSKQQRYDIRRWSFHLLYLTILHEIGHLIGLTHDSQRVIMYPSIITSLEGLTSRDIKRALGLGYKPGKEEEPDKPFIQVGNHKAELDPVEQYETQPRGKCRVRFIEVDQDWTGEL